MPKRVDPDARRTELVDAYLRIISRSGVAAATTRALAAEAGISSGALWHYFTDLNELVDAAFQRVYQRTNERIAQATLDQHGLDALGAMASEILPNNELTRAEAVVVVSFWGSLPASESFKAHARTVEREWAEMVARFLREAVASGDLASETPIDDLTDILLALFDIVQVRFVQASPTAAIEHQNALIAATLQPWRRHHV